MNDNDSRLLYRRDSGVNVSTPSATLTRADILHTSHEGKQTITKTRRLVLCMQVYKHIHTIAHVRWVKTNDHKQEQPKESEIKSFGRENLAGAQVAIASKMRPPANHSHLRDCGKEFQGVCTETSCA
jgi:hypothetical protein